ncbi:SDH family Clp fold serine proteinase [Bacteroides acidifaciens]|uniref:SDH family Clp fold serine proteinase n=1 Tax=Bacteroides acidifaciens TaxID=85831 RepID=UPI00260D161F|nr:serine protease [Bacteroides acidifaciens]
MPTWGQLLRELQPYRDEKGKDIPGKTFDELRFEYLALLHQKTERNVISYYSGWLRPGKSYNIEINDSDMTGFMNAINGLDCSKGLDLILHTPGGSPTATEGIVKYLHKKFGDDIRVIVPQMAMSAGTMLACSAKSIIMGSHSYLGPIDPQFDGIPAYNIISEFNEAKNDLENNPGSKEYWKLKLEKYPPAVFYKVVDSIRLSSELAGDWLMTYMFKRKPIEYAREKTTQILGQLNNNNKSHAKHFSCDDCKRIGLEVEDLEEDQELQELVLSVHHAFIITFDGTAATKIIENHLGMRYVISQAN